MTLTTPTTTPTTTPPTLNPGTGSAPAQPGPLGSMLPSILMTAGILLLVIILMSKQKNRGKKRAPVSEPNERLAELRQAAAGRDTLDLVKADVEELARRLAAQLDNKAARIEKLIADADDRLMRLEQGAARPEPEAPQAAPRLTNHSDDPTRSRIYELADKGLSSIDIARKLDQPTGHVELILSLRSA